MFEIVALGLGAFHQALVRGQRVGRRRGAGPQRTNFRNLRLMSAEGIEQAAVRAHIDERAVGVLTVDFGKRHRDLTQQIEAHRLVVDRRAAWSVGILDSADDEFAISIDPLLLEEGEGRVVSRQRKSGGDNATLGAHPHQGGIAASPQCQPQRIEQDGFASTGFAGQHGEALVEGNVELLDQDDVANGEGGEHGRTL